MTGLSLRVMVYNLLLGLVLMVGLPWLVFSLLFLPRRRVGIRARFGAAPRMEGAVWVHAVSVGEVRAVIPLLPLLAASPGARRPLGLSTVTVTGQATAVREARHADRVFYYPLDLPLVVGRALDRVRPALFVTAETEVWPNFLAACFARRIPVAVVNGRISDRSFARYLRFSWLFRPFFARIDLFLMQSAEDSARVRRLGARPERVAVTGNMKYDITPRDVEVPRAVLAWARKGPVLAAASTHRGEEEIILSLLSRPEPSLSGLRLALVPRHPERFAEVAGLLRSRGVPFLRWSAASAFADGESGGEARVLLVDAMGVLDGVYGFSSAAFVGGSLVPVGGHNLLEPAMHSLPLLTGPHTQNFRDITEALVKGGGCLVVADGEALARETAGLLSRPASAAAMGKAAREASERARGASRRNAEFLLSLLAGGRG